MKEFRACFSDLPDPRAANARHELLEVVFIALAALLCGAEGCSDMAEFGEAKEPFLRQFLKLEHGIPSHDTFSRVFRVLDPQAFERFRQFMAGFPESLSGVVAIDGKAVRGAFERGRRSTPLHLVNVWAAEARLAIAQRLAPNRNEVAGALEVLQLLSFKDCIVTADALHCHAKMAQGVLDRGGEYVLTLKENQSALFADARDLLETAAGLEQGEPEVVKGHGREEQRAVTVVVAEALATKHGFPGLTALARVELRRRVDGREEKPLVRYFALSQAILAGARPCDLTDALGHREPATLGARRRLRRGPCPKPKRQWTAEPGHLTQVGPQPTPFPPRTSLRSDAKSSMPAGMTTSCSVSSPKCDSPALQGRVSTFLPPIAPDRRRGAALAAPYGYLNRTSSMPAASHHMW